ncbi:hypothetical protein IRZ71_05970 [Flavobacterium sp. ANB]|uniref:hypothetical protein n=1 Tax=unclassified Flavobacterium TaxID=196869 RepID=UPI0012B92D3B|nr:MULTISPECIES: hypothetical protein [unclassified Flavobacterium]MBF4515878.1 hypothetical protein [Flavobacterium sp. ANB]MTD68880.1 hypothetical protein [Flavobacterium sp. LC2016-13]
MKKILLSIAMFSTIYISAQAVIVEEKYEDRNEPITFQYLPNSKKIVVYKGSPISMSYSYITTNALSFDVNGKKSVLFENEKLMSPTFSVTENTYKANDATKIKKANYKYFQDKNVFPVNYDTLEDLNTNYFGRYDYNSVLCAVEDRSSEMFFDASFNDSHDFGFTNQKQKGTINFEKDDIYLESIEITSNARKRFKLEKPNLSLLKGDAFAEQDYKTSFICKLNGNENFDIITKSVSADFQTTILYKTTYDFVGKKINEIPLTLKLNNKFFITSDNSGGPKGFVSAYEKPGNPFTAAAKGLGTLSVNNYYEDKKTGDIFVYGAFSEKATKIIGGVTTPKGFYVFKFDKNGTKLWESINAIVSKDFFEKTHTSSRLQINLLEYKKDLIFSVSVNDFTEFSYSTKVDKLTGSISKINFIEYNNNTSNLKNKAFINNSYVSGEFKNKVFSQMTFVAMIVNPNVMSYVKSVSKDGKKLYYESIICDEGIWLVETDNKESYKILFFKD